MSEPILEVTSEMASLSTRLRAEAEQMHVATRRQGIVYIVLAIIIGGYLSWAYRRAAQFIDAEAMAQSTGEQAVKRALDLVFQAAGEARASAPTVVRGVESAFVSSMPDHGKELVSELRDQPKVALKASLGAYDAAFMDELGKLPDGKKRIAAIASNPGEAARLVEALRPKVRAHPELAAGLAAPQSLVATRDQMRQLADNAGLNAAEQVQRRLLQELVVKANLVHP